MEWHIQLYNIRENKNVRWSVRFVDFLKVCSLSARGHHILFSVRQDFALNKVIGESILDGSCSL